MTSECVFCRILSGQERASVIFRDDRVTAFMGHRPIRPGEFMVIPNKHIDHFSDLDEDLCLAVTRVAHRLGQALKPEFGCTRVGWIVHGYGVPHAHLIVVPLHVSSDITSARYLSVDNGEIVTSPCPLLSHTQLDEHAGKIARFAGV